MLTTAIGPAGANSAALRGESTRVDVGHVNDIIKTYVVCKFFLTAAAWTNSTGSIGACGDRELRWIGSSPNGCRSRKMSRDRRPGFNQIRYASRSIVTDTPNETAGRSRSTNVLPLRTKMGDVSFQADNGLQALRLVPLDHDCLDAADGFSVTPW